MNKKRWCIFVCLLLGVMLFVVLGIRNRNREISLDEDLVPTSSGGVKAYFYVTKDVDDSGHPNALKRVGEGYISLREEYDDVNELVQNCVLDEEYADYNVSWDKLICVANKNYVVGHLLPANTRAASVFDVDGYSSVEEMKQDISLAVGDEVCTLGYYSYDDGGGCNYIIAAKASSAQKYQPAIALDNGLFAIADFGDTVSVKQYGAVGDGVTDNYTMINDALRYTMSTGKVLYFPAGSYYCSTMLVIDSNLSIIGDSSETSELLFADYIKTPKDYSSGLLRGVVTSIADYLEIDGLTIRYCANNNTNYKMGSEEGGYHGVLVAALKGNAIEFKNSDFIVEGAVNPAVTCIWLKSELKDICNVVVDNCSIINTSTATAGGGIWISAHDTDTTKLDNVTIKNSYFYKVGNDESIAIWGYRVYNVDVYDNLLEYSGKRNDVLMTYGGTNVGEYKNIKFRNNTVKADYANCDAVIVKVSNTTADSDIQISSNEFYVSNTRSGNVSFIRFVNMGNASVSGNYYSCEGGSVVAYIMYDACGNIAIEKDEVATRNSVISMMIKSGRSVNFNNSSVAMTNCKFDLGATNTQSEMNTVQFPANGLLTMNNCTIGTSTSAIHEFKIQTLYDGEELNDSGGIILNDIECDGNFIIKATKESDRNLVLNNVNASRISLIFPEEKSYFKNIEYTNNEGASLAVNYRATSADTLESYCDELSHSE